MSFGMVSRLLEVKTHQKLREASSAFVKRQELKSQRGKRTLPEIFYSIAGELSSCTPVYNIQSSSCNLHHPISRSSRSKGVRHPAAFQGLQLGLHCRLTSAMVLLRTDRQGLTCGP